MDTSAGMYEVTDDDFERRAKMIKGNTNLDFLDGHRDELIENVRHLQTLRIVGMLTEPRESDR